MIRMGLTKFKIYFSNPDAIYIAGSIVEGQVIIGLNKAMKHKGIKLKFKGQAKVHWSESHGIGEDERTDIYEDFETYFDQDTIIFEPEQGTSFTELGNGTHTFEFQFQLPSTIPSSYQDYIGEVLYFVECKLLRPRNTDLKEKRPFKVITPLDLNLLNCDRPVNGSNQKRLCCLCCKSGPISASLYLDRQGYVPGEAVAVKAEINNDSNRRILKSIVVLERESRYHSGSALRTEVKQVAGVKRPGFRAGGDDVWNVNQLVIPPAPPSFMNYCRLIDVEYRVKLTVVPAGPAIDLALSLPVIIGNIPLRPVVQQHQSWAPPAQDAYTLYGASPARTTHPPSPSEMTNQPPPSYESIIEADVSSNTGDLTNPQPYTFHNWSYLP